MKDLGYDLLPEKLNGKKHYRKCKGLYLGGGTVNRFALCLLGSLLLFIPSGLAQDYPSVINETGYTGQIVVVLDARLYLFDLQATTQTLMLRDDEEWSGVADPDWSPDGTKVVFVAGVFDDPDDYISQTEIFVVNADGSDPIRLTNNPANDKFPKWSPDGQKIAFTSQRDGNWEIYVMNADGSSQTNITQDEADDGEWGLTWSPDGQKIAFVTNRGYRIEQPDGSFFTLSTLVSTIAIGDDLTGRSISLTSGNECPAGDFFRNPTWSPDGNYLAVSYGCTTDADIYLLDVGNDAHEVVASESVNLTNNPGVGDGVQGLDWSPDGNFIVFVATPVWAFEEGNKPQNFFILDLADSFERGQTQVIQLTSNESVYAYYTSPAWKPE